MTDRTVVYRIQADVKQAQAQVAAFGASVRKAADDTTAATKEGQKYRAGLDSLGSAAGKVGLVAAAGLGAAVAVAANFDEAMSKVQAATMESAANMGTLREAALKAGADTVFSATEAADGIEQLAKAGVSTSDILGGGLTGALDLAAAGTLDVGVASEIAATTMNQFGLAGTDVSHIADVLAASAGKAMGEVTDMAAALKYVGPVAAQMGISLEEASGSIAYLATQGVLGEQAGTSLRGMLTALTSPSKIAADEMGRLGINMYDAQGQFIGLEGLAGQLQGTMTNLSAAERDAALGRIFGNEQITTARILYKGGASAVEEWTNKVDDSGFAAEVAAIKLNNLKGDFEALKGSLETALINTGDGSQGPLRTLTQGLTGVINKYNELPGAAQNATAAFAAVTAVAGGGIWAFAKTVQGISNVRTTLSNLGTTAGGIKGKLKSVASFVGGPWGLAFAGATILLGDYLQQQAKTEGYVDSLTAALDDQTGAMTRNAIATNLQDEGWLEYAESIGVASDVVIDAVLGSAEAMQTVRDAAGEHDGFFGGLGEAEDAKQFVANVEAQSAAQKQAQKNAELLAAANGDTAESATSASGATDRLTGATGALGTAAYKTAEQVKAQKEALQKARDAAQETARGFINLGDGLDDAKVSLGEWIAEMANQADALNNFMTNAKQASKRGLRDGLINDLQDAGTAGALRMKQLANATDEEIARANKAWKRGQDAMQRYVDFKVPPKKVDVKIDEAMTAIERIRAAMLGIKDKSVTVRVTQTGAAVSPGFGPQANAEGGFITGPGTATSDSIPSYLSNGEYVVKAAAVEKYGVHMFDRLNAMHFAEGGSVKKGDKPKPKRTRAFSVTDTTDGLQAALDRLTRVSDDQTAALEATRSALEDTASAVEFWGDKMSDVAQATVSGFNTDLFAKSSNPWASGAGGGPLANLTKDIAGLTERANLQSQLAGAGLSGDALAALLSQGSNSDLSAILGSGQTAQYAALFNQRAALQGSVGAAAGQQAYGGQYAAAQQAQQQATAAVTQQLAEVQRATAATQRMEARINTMAVQIERLNADQPERTGEAVGRVINGAAATGHRQRNWSN